MDNTKKCPRCGKMIPMKTKYCPGCGYQFDDVPVPAPAPAPASAPAPSPAPSPAPFASQEPAPQTGSCPRCGRTVPANTKFCPGCGFQFGGAPAPSPAPFSQEPAPQTNTCPRCGKIVPAGMKFCTGCGLKLNEEPAPAQSPFGQQEPSPAPSPFSKQEPAQEQGQAQYHYSFPGVGPAGTEGSSGAPAGQNAGFGTPAGQNAGFGANAKKEGNKKLMILAPVLVGAVILFSAGLIFFVKNKGKNSESAVAERSVTQETLKEIKEEKTETAAETKKAAPEKTPATKAAAEEKETAPAVKETTKASAPPEDKKPSKASEDSSVQKGWSSSPKGWKYYDENGRMLANEWLEDGTDHWFYFGADGYMLHDTMTPDGYYVGSDGEMTSNPPAGQSAAQTAAQTAAQQQPYGMTFGTGTALPAASTAQISGEYVFPNSSSVALTAADMNGKTEWECRVARNEIYARHGRKFKDTALQAYFDGCSWYKGTISPEAFRDDAVLSRLEKDNIKVIENYEKQHHYNNH